MRIPVRVVLILFGCSLGLLTLLTIHYSFNLYKESPTADIVLTSEESEYVNTSFSNDAPGSFGLWDFKNRERGYNSEYDLSNSTSHSIRVCTDFFSVWLGGCVRNYDDLNDRLRILSAQMEVMNSTLTLYVTSLLMCGFNYSRVEVALFDDRDILRTYGFAAVLPIIKSWDDKNVLTRISDILRICLAHRYQKSYLDTDMHFLDLQKNLFERSYVGAAVWSDREQSLEITNAAFCLPRAVLRDMMGFLLYRINTGSSKYFYTELGPSMFQRVLMNRFSVPLYSQNNPYGADIEEIAIHVHKYVHLQLHITGMIRKVNRAMPFSTLANAVRERAGLPTLSLPPLSKSPSLDSPRH